MAEIHSTQTSFNQALINFLAQSPTPYHCVKNMVNQLRGNGFKQLFENDNWQLNDNDGYFVTRNDSSIIAFTLGDLKNGFRMVGAHTDFPCLKIKPIPEVKQNQYFQLGVEVYGGVLLNTWFDRDLSIAGRVCYLNKNQQMKTQLINFRKPIACIPSLAIHLDKNANKNRTVNAQTDIVPILCQLQEDQLMEFGDILKQHLLECHDKEAEKILDYDLNLYDTNRATLVGLNNEFIASESLDNMLSCFIGLQSIISSQHESNVPTLLVCNDHEECGSQSAIGAQGPMLKSVLKRLTRSEEKYVRVVDQSFFISTDNAHGVHPNYVKAHEKNHLPLLNHGVVLKFNHNQSYASTDITSAIFKLLCQEIHANYQHYVVRSDLRCGSTIGPISSSILGVKTLDIGLPTFAMHSIRELAGSKDAYELFLLLNKFFIKRNMYDKLD